MSRKPARNLPALPPPTSQTYEVGYGKPPATSRFKAGHSGNPRGRPKGARNKMPALNEERLKSIILTEAYRTIKVNDGPRQVSVPMAQAVMRSVAVNAVKGPHRSQRLFSELLSATDRDNKALHDEWLEAALDYKKSWQDEIERCRQFNLPPPDPVPHPDHIDLDMRTGQIVVDGPMTYKQRDVDRRLITHLMDGLDASGWFAKERKRTRDPEQRARLDDLIAQETRHCDRLLGRVLDVPWLVRESFEGEESQRRRLASDQARR